MVAPRIGTLAATLVELPLVLGFAWWAAGRLVRRLAVPQGAARWWMGAVALALLLTLEFGLGVVLRGWSFETSLAHFRTAPGLLALAAYVAFAALPRLQRQP